LTDPTVPEPASAPGPPGTPPGADGPHRLDPRIVLVWRFALLPTVILPSTVLGGLLTRLLPVPGWSIAVPLAVLLGVVVGPLQTRRWLGWSWRLTDTAVELRSGVLTRRHVVVPHFRVQQIDVLEGPLERLLGLATLTVTTASAAGSVSLPGLAADAAPAVRAELLARAARADAEHGRSGRDAV
jgi:membrane protein YdbS with pleckstrin-like domain